VHRDDAKRRPAKRRPLEARGKLFDWQWYNDQLSKRPRHTTGRWSAGASCSACGGLIPSSARRCPRCGAPRSRRRLLPVVVALIGLAAFGAVLALGAHMLGGSVPEAQAPRPVGHYTDDDIVIVEMPPATPSPFGTTMQPSNAAPSSGGNATAR